MSVNFCAALPNFRTMEIEVDDVPWINNLVTHPPEIRRGEYVVSARPGWGTDVKEESVVAKLSRYLNSSGCSNLGYQILSRNEVVRSFSLAVVLYKN